MTTILWGYVIPEPSLPQPHDTESRPADCEECGDQMEWYDGYCYDPECDCQHYSPRVHASTGLARCGKEV
jgi:hypothetical protein